MKSILRCALVTSVFITALASTGCISKMLLNGQIEVARKASAAMQTTTDLEIARTAGASGLATFESLYYLAPENEDALYLLIKNYTGYAFAFIEDEYEAAALEGKEAFVNSQKQRAYSLYTRAVGFGSLWLERKHPGFNTAVQSGDEKTVATYLKQFDDKSDADLLFWIANAWMARVGVFKELRLVATLFVGRLLAERALELNESVEGGAAHLLLGAYDARTGHALIGDESFQKSKAHFDRAIAMTEGKVLLVHVQMARMYACHMKDETPGRTQSRALYMQLLNEVLNAKDFPAETRLANAIAKRRALRYVSKRWIREFAREDCGWDP